MYRKQCNYSYMIRLLLSLEIKNFKGGGVQKFMDSKVPWKTGVLIYLPVFSQPLVFLAERSSNFATTHLTVCILDFYLPCTSRPMKRRTLSQRPKNVMICDKVVLLKAAMGLHMRRQEIEIAELRKEVDSHLDLQEQSGVKERSLDLQCCAVKRQSCKGQQE